MASPSDELVTRILAALERLPDDRAQRLVGEAWEQAEDAVREVLTTAMRAALLRRTASVLEGGPPGRNSDAGADTPPSSDVTEPPLSQQVEPPAPPPAAEAPLSPPSVEAAAPSPPTTDAGFAWYVYGITPAGELNLSEDVRGVDPDISVEMVSHNGLDALVSRVRTEEFGPDALRERLTERVWLEEKVRLHEEVLQVALQAHALVPMRFCTVVRSADDVVTFLDDHEPSLRRGLADLAGKREWGVKVATVPSRFDQHVRQVSEEVRSLDEQAARKGSGQAYFLTKRRRQLLEAEGDRIAGEFAAACHDRLRAVAARAAALEPRRQGEDTDERMVLNGAYLVEEQRHERFAAVVDELAEEGAAPGLTVQLTGPWPAYSFVEPDMATEVAR